MSLSDKISEGDYDLRFGTLEYVDIKDVKEFIKEVKKSIKSGMIGDTNMGEPSLIRNEWAIIDKLAGEKLI